MTYNQRDVVNVESKLPDGKDAIHPFIIISSSRVSSNEGYFTGIMVTSSQHTDKCTFKLDHLMFESRLEKENCQARLHIIIGFSARDIRTFKGRMKPIHFKALMAEIKDTTFYID